MTILGDGLTTTLILLAIAILAHEPWRWLGLYLGRDLDVESELFLWVRAVATALVAGLVMRMSLFPAGDLAAVPLWLRGLAFVVGIAAYLAWRRSLAVGVASGAAVLLLVGLAIG